MFFFRVLILSQIVFGMTVYADISLYFWRPDEWTEKESTNFGDELSKAIIERMIGRPIQRAHCEQKGKLLGLGSILQFAKPGDIVWGTGMNGKDLKRGYYNFLSLDVRAVRGPLTKAFIEKCGGPKCSIFGDPALLIPRLFPEFKKCKSPRYKYVVLPHISEVNLFPNRECVIFPTEDWKSIVRKILDSRFVISSSLHGIIVAEAYGIPARFLRISQNEPDFKYLDYYLGTGRKRFKSARSIKEALKMGGEPRAKCDLNALYQAFPFDKF